VLRTSRKSVLRTSRKSVLRTSRKSVLRTSRKSVLRTTGDGFITPSLMAELRVGTALVFVPSGNAA
jgi:hypothetical protein